MKAALVLPAIVAAALAAAILYLAFWPVGLDFAAWAPPRAPPRAGALAPDDRLARVEWLGRGVADGPESTAVDAEGRVVLGTADGRVLRRREDGRFDELARTGGRPLGLAFLPDGSLAVADRDRGLLRIVPAEPGGRVEVLATSAEGAPLGFADDVTAAPDGTLYFTDATTRRKGYRDDFFEHRGRGRLLTRSPDGRVEVLLRGLHFANGVALGPGGAYLVVNETAEYRVVRYWLAGPRKGEAEPLVENLPGFPDNVTWSQDRRVFWVALWPRVKVLDALLPHPFLRAMVYRLPRALQPEPEKHAWVIAVDETGRIVENLEHAGPDAYAPTTSVREADGWLWLGSLEADGLGRVRAP